MKLDRAKTSTVLLRRKVSAILRTDDKEVARNAMQAAVAGGFRTIEFTLTIPGALELVTEFSSDARLCVGVGTVLDPNAVLAARDAGARFVVSPVCDPEVIRSARKLDLVTIPGTYTATEMFTAHRAGADFVKLFPGPANLIEYLNALRGPLPQLRIIPTAGITLDNFAAVLEAGAAGVGFVRPLFEPEDLARGRFEAIETRARAIHHTLRERKLLPLADPD